MSKVKTAWVSVFGDYEWGLIDKLRKNGFDIDRMNIVGKAIAEIEKKEYYLNQQKQREQKLMQL